MYFCHKLMEIYLNMGNVDFLVNVRMLKVGSELRYGIRSPNVRTPVDIPKRKRLTSNTEHNVFALPIL